MSPNPFLQDRFGWMAPLPEFPATDRKEVLAGLRRSYPDSGPEEVASWRGSIPELQKICANLAGSLPQARDGSIVLEYTLPSGEGRCDAIVLMDGMIGILEFKGKTFPSEEDLDQVRCYYRELRWNHVECVPPRKVVPVLVPLRSPSFSSRDDEVLISSPDQLPSVLSHQALDSSPSLSGAAFTADDVARVSLDIVRSARALFEASALPRVKRASADTRPAVESALEACQAAALSKTRKLIFVSGVPGSGKTLVGLKLAHTSALDPLTSYRGTRKPTAPLLYLSGNAPLVRVLRHSLQDVSGGRAFVGDVMDWIRRHVRTNSLKTPDEHVIIFDEAQRAWDAERMRAKHSARGLPDTGSEPETLLRIMSTVPDWSVVVALIGQGQAIHVGEEGGVGLWPAALRALPASSWEVMGPSWVHRDYDWNGILYKDNPTLELRVSRRQAFASSYPGLVDALLTDAPPKECSDLALNLRREAGQSAPSCEPFHLCVTRSLVSAKKHSRREISPMTGGLCGLLVSSKDRMLQKRYGVKSDLFVAGALTEPDWFAPATESSLSCTWLLTAATEFQVQGLELDLGIVCWGEDLIWDGSGWNSTDARPYKKGTQVENPHALRVNSYRVLLTRGRRGSIIFVPPERKMDLTFQRLVDAGFLDITPPSLS